MTRILKYSLSILLVVLIANVINAQPGRKKGLRVGYDLSRLALSYIDTDRKPFEVSVDYEILPKYYATFEYGKEIIGKVLIRNLNSSSENGEETIVLPPSGYSYNSSGTYGRIGFDINTLQKKLRVDQYEMSFIGFRYAYSSYYYTTPSITITDTYWQGSTSAFTNRVNARTHWFEVVGGIRGELYKGLFIGWSFRARLRLANTKDEIMDALYIPGYGKGSKRMLLGFNYSIYYKIPMYTVKAKAKDNPVPEE